MRRYWYGYTGIEGNEFNLSNYNLVADPSGCDEGHLLCVIYTFAGGQHPSHLTPNLPDYIIAGKIDGVNQPQVPGSKFFVYTRT